jgi:uncharacterized protein (DUF2147 family)
MKNGIQLLFILSIVLAANTTFAANADDILGEWFNEEKDSKIEVLKCGEKYCGKVVWLKDPNYPEGDKNGIPGTPLLDHNNPNPGLRKTPIIGLQIMYGFSFDGGNIWSGGKVYDPKNGNTYKGKMTLVSPKTLKLRGFIGISLLGRNTVWTR